MGVSLGVANEMTEVVQGQRVPMVRVWLSWVNESQLGALKIVQRLLDVY